MITPLLAKSVDFGANLISAKNIPLRRLDALANKPDAERFYSIDIKSAVM